MRSCCFLVLTLSIVACKDKPKDAPAPTPPVAAAKLDAAAAPPATESPKAAPPGCDGWRASKTEHMGMGWMTVTVECAHDKLAVTLETVEARGDAETTHGTITRDVWNTLWQRLETAGWRKLPDTCAPLTPPPDSASRTELDLAITDGKARKQITCKGLDVTAAHEDIVSALDAVAEATTDRKTD
ncbi:MAG TPA: hypothetical protein VFQ53_31410 [Kofleriaceae bacterium]|nr:hypothetical protein [Kofleriaceae bacterium]